MQLLCANFKGNPVCTHSSYRSYIVSKLECLLCLDERLILTLERCEVSRRYHDNAQGSLWNPRMRFDLSCPSQLLDVSKVTDSHDLIKLISIRVRCLRTLVNDEDPVLKIQAVWKSVLYNHYLKKFENYVVQLQAACRGKMWRLRVARELNQILQVTEFSRPEEVGKSSVNNAADVFYVVIIIR